MRSLKQSITSVHLCFSWLYDGSCPMAEEAAVLPTGRCQPVHPGVCMLVVATVVLPPSTALCLPNKENNFHLTYTMCEDERNLSSSHFWLCWKCFCSLNRFGYWKYPNEWTPVLAVGLGYVLEAPLSSWNLTCLQVLEQQILPLLSLWY